MVASESGRLALGEAGASADAAAGMSGGASAGAAAAEVAAAAELLLGAAGVGRTGLERERIVVDVDLRTGSGGTKCL